MVCLQQTRENNVALLLVLVTELGAVGTLLALGPDVHLSGTNANEESNRPVAASNDDTDPGHNLKHVVRTGDEAEAVSPGDLALGATGRSEGGQVVVNEGVASLAKDEKGGASGVDHRLVRASGERPGVVHGQGAEDTRNRPVEEAVLEDVEEGHRVGRELVDKGRFELALEEVGDEHAENEPLRLGHVGLAALVDIRSSCDDGAVGEDGTKVLDEEDGAPANLRA